MHLRWRTYADLKNVMSAVDFKKLLQDQEEWGGLGVIVTSTPEHYNVEPDSKLGGKTNYMLTGIPCGDTIIVTPYAKEVSWLIEEVLYGPPFGNMNPFEKVLFFIKYAIATQDQENRTPEEMIMCILDFLAKEERAIENQQFAEDRK